MMMMSNVIQNSPKIRMTCVCVLMRFSVYENFAEIDAYSRLPSILVFSVFFLCRFLHSIRDPSAKKKISTFQCVKYPFHSFSSSPSFVIFRCVFFFLSFCFEFFVFSASFLFLFTDFALFYLRNVFFKFVTIISPIDYV